MKKVLISLAATLIMVAGFATNADAQRGRGGPGLYRGGGVVVGVGGGGGRFSQAEHTAAPVLSAAPVSDVPPLLEAPVGSVAAAGSEVVGGDRVAL